MNTDARNHYIADFARVAGSLPGAQLPWLQQLRRDAIDAFAQRGFPTRHDEEWKYTSVAGFEQHAFAACTAGSDAIQDSVLSTLAAHVVLDAGRAHFLVFCNGRYASALSAPGHQSGMRLTSLAEALEAAPETVEPYLVDADECLSAFMTLNSAFMADGAFLHLTRGTVLEQPVHLLFLSNQPGRASTTRNIVVAESGAHAVVVEHHVGLDGIAYFTNAVTRIVAAENAVIEHHKLQQEGGGAFHVAGFHALQQRDSRLASHSITLGGVLTRNDITTAFDATGCEAVLDGLYLVGGNQHVDNHTRIDHCSPHGTSRENYRGVLDGRARAVFNGKVVVHPGAQKTNAFQANHNLLLSRDAEIDSKPELEIHADDVKCNHGATIGQLDERQLFYLRSRGIDELAARAVLVHAFAHDVIERIRVASLRARLEQILLTRLQDANRIGELA